MKEFWVIISGSGSLEWANCLPAFSLSRAEVVEPQNRLQVQSASQLTCPINLGLQLLLHSLPLTHTLPYFFLPLSIIFYSFSPRFLSIYHSISFDIFLLTLYSFCPTSLPFLRMGSGFPLPSGVYILAEVTRPRREQQYIDDNLFNHKSRAAMMVNVAMWSNSS